MYRDELAAYRQRLVTAREDAASAWAEARGELEAMGALNEQLAAKKLQRVDVPEVEPLGELPEAGRDAKAAELIRLCGQLEAEVERVRRDAAMLRRVNRVLNARVQGKSAHLPLGPAPRRVPLTYLLAQTFALSPMVLVFGIIAVVVAGGVVAAFFGTPLAVTALATLVLALLLALALDKIRFLARCKLAVGVTVASTASGSSSYTNWPLPVARGWEVRHESYSGHSVETTVEFLTDAGDTRSVVIKGRPYEDGVVLYDPGSFKAYCVSQLRCAPRPDATGRWRAGLSLGVWIRLLIAGTLTVGAMVTPLLISLALI